MKHCSHCKQLKSFEAFPRDRSTKTGYNKWCRECVRQKDSKPDRVEARRNYEHTERGRSRRQNYPEKVLAGNLLRKAVKAGKMVRPHKCEVCNETPKNRLGKPMIEAHHHDYSKPFDVIWLCKLCHAAEHSRIRAQPIELPLIP